MYIEESIMDVVLFFDIEKEFMDWVECIVWCMVIMVDI